MFLILGTICCVVAWWLWSSREKRLRGMHLPPMFPGAWPIIGHSLMLLGNCQQLWKVIKKVCEDTVESGFNAYTTNIGTISIHWIIDPEDCYTVANSCLQKNIIYDFFKPWVGNGLVTADVPVWKVHRKLLNPTFNQQVLDGFLSVFNSQARKLNENLSVEVGKNPFDHFKHISNITIRTICMTAMGAGDDQDKKMNDIYMDANHRCLNGIVGRFQKVWLHSNFIYKFSNHKKTEDELVQTLHKMSDTMIEKRKAVFNSSKTKNIEKISSDKSQYKALLDYMLEISENGALTDIEVREQVDTVIAAGSDTTALGLVFALTVLGSYPEVQERIFTELQEIFDGSERDVEKQDLSKLIYLEAVIKETMRLYPIVPVIARYLHKDMKLKNYTLPAGSSCFIAIYGLHRHPMWGPDANEFKPERWLDPASLPASPYAFAGFGLGRRQCVGLNYTLMVLKTTLAHILRRYRIHSDISKLELQIDVVLRPVSGYFISIENRS